MYFGLEIEYLILLYLPSCIGNEYYFNEKIDLSFIKLSNVRAKQTRHFFELLDREIETAHINASFNQSKV
jgi:hypothetical protein